MTKESSTTRTDDGADEPIKVTISIPQVIGGALAAATAAAIGSQLGVAGTILGAAVASIVGGLAGMFYSAGLDRTHRKVRQVIRRSSQRSAAEESDLESVATGVGMPEAPQVGEPEPIDVEPELRGGRAGSWSSRDRRRMVERLVLSVAVIFVVAVGAITAIELGLGRSLDGSAGTTIGQVSRPAPKASASPKPTATATETPTPSPSTPSAPPSPSVVPSVSEYPSPTPTLWPTPAATAS